MKQSPCFRCTERFDRCHGKNPDGSWRCEKYRKYHQAGVDILKAKIALSHAENDVTACKKIKRRVT